MKPTTSQLYAECQKLAEELPNFLYEPEDLAIGCSNTQGGDGRYPDNCGCIVGQAFKRLTGELVPEQHDLAEVTSLISYKVVQHDSCLEEIKSLQAKQDDGYTWAVAIKFKA